MVSLEKAGRLQNPFFLRCPRDSSLTHICISPSIPEVVILTNGSQFTRIDARTGSCTCSGSVRSNRTHASISSPVWLRLPPPFVESPIFNAAFPSKKLHSRPYSQNETLSCMVEGGHTVEGVLRSPLLVQATGTVQEPELAITDLQFGGMYTPIKLSPPPRSSMKGGGGYIKCMAGGKGGIVFIVRHGEETLHGMIIDPPEDRGSTSIRVRCTDHSGGIVKAVSCAPRNFSVALAMSSGEVRLYSYASVMEFRSSSSSSSSYNNYPSRGSEGSFKFTPRASAQTTVKHMDVEGEMDTARGTRLNEDLKPPLRPRLRGKLKLTAILETRGEVGMVAVWNLEDKGILDTRGKKAASVPSLFFVEHDRSNGITQAATIKVQPFAIHHEMELSSAETPMPNIVSIGFHPYEPFVVAIEDVKEEVLNSHLSSSNKKHERSKTSNHSSSYLSVLSIMDAQMPFAGRFPLPYPVYSFVLEPTSCLLFFSWAETTTILQQEYLECFRLVSEKVPDSWSHPLVGSSIACPAAVFIDEWLKGKVSSSSSSSRSECTLLEQQLNKKNELKEQQINQSLSFSGLELPLITYFLRSMVVVIKAGPGGGVDIPAIKSVLFGQPLERDIKMRGRGKPRRLVSLPGHTDDVAHKLEKEEEEEEEGSKDLPSSPSSFISGHLKPYHLAVGPFIGDKRRFLIAYEVLPNNDWDAAATLKMQDVPLNQQPTRSVFGLVTQPGYGELETEANISRLVAANDGCFVPIRGYNEPYALLVEAHGFKVSVYGVPKLNLISSQEVSLPVSRVFPVPQNTYSPDSSAAVDNMKNSPPPHHGHHQLLYVLRESSPLHCTWTSLGNAGNFVEILVYSTTVSRDQCCPQVPTLSSTLLNPDKGHSISQPYLRLLPRERVLDVGFQPAVALNTEDGKLWGDASGGQMAFVLTSYRVLIVSVITLQVISSYGDISRNQQQEQEQGWREDVMKLNNSSFQNWRLSAHPLASIPISALWFGGGVLVLLDDGEVLLLVPGSTNRIRSVCSIERNLCNGGCAVIAAALPDRICLLVRGGGASGACHLLTKPLMPLEPLLAGLLEPEWRRGRARMSREQHLVLGLQRHGVKDQVSGGEGEGAEESELPDEIVTTTAAKIVMRYAPPLKGEPLSGETGPGINAGATKAAFDLLMDFGLTRLSLDVAGIMKSPEPLCGTRLAFFRRRPWIGFGERCLAAVDEDLPLVAAIEAIGDDPALIECTCDVDGMVSPYLPRQQSTLARILLIIADWCQKSGRLETARCLLDIAGAEGALVELLKSTITEGGKEYLHALHTIRNSGKGALQAVPDPTVTFSISKALCEAGEMGEFVQIGPTPSIIRNGTFRDRESLLITQDHSLPELNPTKRLVVEEFDSSGLHKRTAPPSLGLHRLTLNCLEEWTGRSRPECISEEEGYSSKATAAAAQCVTSSSFSNYGDRTNWVVVGCGRNANDNICGYWRFAEGEQMVGRGVIASLEVTNLSKFGGVGEVRGAELMETTSPIDPGDGIKVSRAMDVCFPLTSDTIHFPSTQIGETKGSTGVNYNSWKNAYKTGIFILCPRGSALDLGLFHNEPHRSMLTVELYVMHLGGNDEADALDALSPGYHTLVARYHNGYQDQNSSGSCPGSKDDKDAFVSAQNGAPCHLWSLTVEQDRRICFVPGPLSRAGTKISPSGKIRGVVCSEAGAVPIGRWTHIALTLDSSRYEMAADITLYIDCVPVGKGRCRFNKVPQYAIQQTVLAVGPDLRGWRLTDLRIWAMCRDSNELSDHKNIWLLQAEHRKGRFVIRDSPSTSTVMVPSLASGRKGSLVKKNELPLPPPTDEKAATWADACRIPPPGSNYTTIPRFGGDHSPYHRDSRKLALAAKNNGSEQLENCKNLNSSGNSTKDVLRAHHHGQDSHPSRIDNSSESYIINTGGGWPVSSPNAALHSPQHSLQTTKNNTEMQGWATFPSDNVTGKESSPSNTSGQDNNNT